MLPLAVVWLCCFIPFSTHSPSLREPGNLVWSMHTFQRTVVSFLPILSPKTKKKKQKLSHSLKCLLPVSGLEHSDLPALGRLSLSSWVWVCWVVLCVKISALHTPSCHRWSWTGNFRCVFNYRRAGVRVYRGANCYWGEFFGGELLRK